MEGRMCGRLNNEIILGDTRTETLDETGMAKIQAVPQRSF